MLVSIFAFLALMPYLNVFAEVPNHRYISDELPLDLFEPVAASTEKAIFKLSPSQLQGSKEPVKTEEFEAPKIPQHGIYKIERNLTVDENTLSTAVNITNSSEADNVDERLKKMVEKHVEYERRRNNNQHQRATTPRTPMYYGDENSYPPYRNINLDYSQGRRDQIQDRARSNFRTWRTQSQTQAQSNDENYNDDTIPTFHRQGIVYPGLPTNPIIPQVNNYYNRNNLPVDGNVPDARQLFLNQLQNPILNPVQNVMFGRRGIVPFPQSSVLTQPMTNYRSFEYQHNYDSNSGPEGYGYYREQDSSGGAPIHISWG